jgi:hypothetical protein
MEMRVRSPLACGFNQTPVFRANSEENYDEKRKGAGTRDTYSNNAIIVLRKWGLRQTLGVFLHH